MACATQTQFRRGTAAANATFTGVEGEVTYATDTHQLFTHDGVTVGGFALELISNKSNDTSLTASSATLYPTQNAVKTYVNNGLALKVAKAGDSMAGTLTVTNGVQAVILNPAGTGSFSGQLTLSLAPSSGTDAANKTYVDSRTGYAPIGAILPWAKSITGTPALPSGWQECNGGAIASGPMAGQNTPNLNGNRQFLRGQTISGGTGGATTHTHTYAGNTDVEDGDTDVSANDATAIALGIGAATVAAAGHVHPFSGTTDSASSLPPYFEVVYIIRIS